MKEQLMFDVHTHMIPNMDDGAESRDEASEMLRASFNQGVRHIFLTPHYNEEQGLVTRGDASSEMMKALAAEISSELHVYFGNEVFYTSGTAEQLRSGAAMTLASSKYVLIEFATDAAFDVIAKAVHDLMLHGFWPILAHVERYDLVHTSVDKLRWLIDAGAWFQVNANSFFSKRIPTRMFLRKLVSNNWVHFIASDCHNMTTRKPNLERTAARLSQKYGKDFVRRVFTENPTNILKNTR